MTLGKINIKIGTIEASYEGNEETLKENLLSTMREIKEMFNIDDIPITPPQTQLQDNQVNKPRKIIQGTVTNIASKLGVSNGPDLVMATATYLTLVEDCKQFTRRQLIDKMKTASSFFKSNYISNLTYTITGLIKKGKLNEITKDTYALPVDVIKEMESKLAS